MSRPGNYLMLLKSFAERFIPIFFISVYGLRISSAPKIEIYSRPGEFTNLEIVE